MADIDKESIKSRIGSFFNDVATLDVLTLTGDITLVNANATDGTSGEFQWDDLFKKVAEKMKASDDSKLSVVAYTHSEWDLDTVNFVTSELTDGTKDLLEAHNSAVKAAQLSRFEAMRTMAGLIRLKL